MFFVLDQAKPILLTKGQDQLGELVIANPGLHLPVQGVDRRLAQWEAIDLFNSLAEFREIKQSAFDLIGVAFQSLVSSKACAGRTAELSANLFLLGCDMFNTFRHHGVVIFLPRQNRRVRLTRCNL